MKLRSSRRIRWVLAFSIISILSHVIASAALPEYDRVRTLAERRNIDEIALVDQEGREFELSQLRGKVVLVFFGYTNCPDVCPLTMANWRALETSGMVDLERVAFVLISVDGERDKPDVLKAYLEQFSNRFIGLTDEPTKIKPFAKQFSAAFYKGSPSTHEGHYDVTHSPQAYVLDTTGLLSAEFYSPTTDAMAGIIRALLAENSGSAQSAD